MNIKDVEKEFLKKQIMEELTKIQSDEDRTENILKMFEKIISEQEKNFNLKLRYL